MIEPMFAYLDALRLSGATNMFGAAPYLVEEFGVTRAQAKRVLVMWMQSYGDGTRSPKTRAETAFTNALEDQ